MKTQPILLAAAATLLALSMGCVAKTEPAAPLDSTKYTLENTEHFVLLDHLAPHTVTCTGLQQSWLPDGRLEVVANVKNRESKRLEVQVNCVFKDEQGFSTGDETPFQTVILEENATEAVRFTAMNKLAKSYTVRVRQPR